MTKNIHPFYILGLISFLMILSSSSPAYAVAPGLGTGSANDTDITFANLNIVNGISFLIYSANGTLLTETNTTGSVNLAGHGGYLFVIKPTSQSWFQDPVNAINLFTIWLPPMMSYLLWLVVIVATVYIVTRLFK